MKNLKKKIERKKREINNIKRKIQKEERKKRKEKLIKLGTLFKITNLLDVDQETMLGYLSEYINLKKDEKDSLKKIGDFILLNNKKNSYNDYNYNELKKLFFLMIRKSALLEKLKIHLEDPKVILGFLSKFKEKNIEELEKNKKIGSELFNRKIKSSPIISNEKKIELIKFFMKKNIDSTSYLREKLKKDIHSITENEYLNIINSK